MDLNGMCFVMLLHGQDLLYFSVAASVWQKQNFGHQFKSGFNKLISPLPHCLYSSQKAANQNLFAVRIMIATQYFIYPYASPFE